MMKYAALLIVLISSVLSGCSFTAFTKQGAGNVEITKGPISNSCMFKGQVSVASDVSNMSASRHSQLLNDQYNDLRNQANQLGANTVLLSSSSGMINKKHWASKTTHNEYAAHAYSGKAYWCPSN